MTEATEHAQMQTFMCKFLCEHKLCSLFGCARSSLLSVQAFSSCREQGLLSPAVRRLLIAVVSLVVEHGL